MEERDIIRLRSALATKPRSVQFKCFSSLIYCYKTICIRYTYGCTRTTMSCRSEFVYRHQHLSCSHNTSTGERVHYKIYGMYNPFVGPGRKLGPRRPLSLRSPTSSGSIYLEQRDTQEARRSPDHSPDAEAGNCKINKNIARNYKPLRNGEKGRRCPPEVLFK